MPIGVPRIIYCWGEELPAQWTDIYNFIFRRRMIFLMQYLDDELCNQICGLLINIHMEDRSKELEKKEMEKSGLFKSTITTSTSKQNTASSNNNKSQKQNIDSDSSNSSNRTPFSKGGESSLKKNDVRKEIDSFKKGNVITGQKSVEDLLIYEQDLGIDENNTLEQYTLQKITMQWLTWNAQFFNYEDEPYLYYLGEILSKDFGSFLNQDMLSRSGSDKEKKKKNNLLFSTSPPLEGDKISESQVSSNVSESGRFSDVSKIKPVSEEKGMDGVIPSPRVSSKEKDAAHRKERKRIGQDFKKEDAPLLYKLEMTRLMKMLKNVSSFSKKITSQIHISNSSKLLTAKEKNLGSFAKGNFGSKPQSLPNLGSKEAAKESLPPKADQIQKEDLDMGFFLNKKKHFDIYSPFRLIANFAPNKYSFNKLSLFITKGENIGYSIKPNLKKEYAQFKNPQIFFKDSLSPKVFAPQTKGDKEIKKAIHKKFINHLQLKCYLSQQNYSNLVKNKNEKRNASENSLFIRFLKTEYIQDRIPFITKGDTKRLYRRKAYSSLVSRSDTQLPNLGGKGEVASSSSFSKTEPSAFNFPIPKDTPLTQIKKKDFSSASLRKGLSNSMNSNIIFPEKGGRVPFEEPTWDSSKGLGALPNLGRAPKHPSSLIRRASSSKKNLAALPTLVLRRDSEAKPNQSAFVSNPKVVKTIKNKSTLKPNYLNFNAFTNKNFGDYNSFYRKQTERTLQEEESKKVFVIINSFGGSVGNGITVHDALQFIKAGSLTLGLGVAASAASLVLAGGTIGERYVTEGCHTMIHQPEGGLNGQASDIWIDSQEIMKIRLDVAEIYSLSTYRPRHKILRDLDRDFYLTAMETIYYGLADEIATNEVMHEIIEMTSKVWDYHDTKQQRLLETRESANSGTDTQTQS